MVQVKFRREDMKGRLRDHSFDKAFIGVVSIFQEYFYDPGCGVILPRYHEPEDTLIGN